MSSRMIRCLGWNVSSSRSGCREESPSLHVPVGNIFASTFHCSHAILDHIQDQLYDSSFGRGVKDFMYQLTILFQTEAAHSLCGRRSSTSGINGPTAYSLLSMHSYVEYLTQGVLDKLALVEVKQPARFLNSSLHL